MWHDDLHLWGRASWCGFLVVGPFISRSNSPLASSHLPLLPHETPFSAAYSLSVYFSISVSPQTLCTVSNRNHPPTVMMSTWPLCFARVSTLSAFQIEFNFQSSFHTESFQNQSTGIDGCPHSFVHQKSYWVLVEHADSLAPTPLVWTQLFAGGVLVKVILTRFLQLIWWTTRLGNHGSLLNIL